MKLLAKGRTAEIYEWAENKIIKLFNKGFSERVAEIEYKKGVLVSNTEIPTPSVYGVKRIDGRFGIIYDKMRGESLLSKILSKSVDIEEAACLLAEIHYKVNSQEVADLQEQKSFLKFEIDESNWLSESEKSKINDLLKELPAMKNLCHGDFHPDNVIMTSEGPVVIDWLTAVSGNPACDVARTSIMLKFAELPGDLPVSIEILRDFHGIYMNKYLELSNLENKEILEWELVVAAARLNEGISKSEKGKLVDFIRCNI